MGFSVDFTDNKSISAEILNDILAEVGDGSVSASSEFVNDSLFYTDKLNCIRSEIVTGGIRSGCEATLCETGVNIGEGLCFFDSGMRMKIDAEGITLAISEGKENFVYLYSSPISNIATAVVTTEEKESSEYVPVCRIDDEGRIYDARVWCRAKIPMMNSKFVQSETFKIKLMVQNEKTLIKSVPLTNKGYSYIIFMSNESMTLYCRDTKKFAYIISNGYYGNVLVRNMDTFKAGYYSGGNFYFATLSLEEKDSCINLYGLGYQNEIEISMLVI